MFDIRCCCIVEQQKDNHGYNDKGNNETGINQQIKIHIGANYLN
jgi:hypothetical protein